MTDEQAWRERMEDKLDGLSAQVAQQSIDIAVIKAQRDQNGKWWSAGNAVITIILSAITAYFIGHTH